MDRRVARVVVVCMMVGMGVLGSGCPARRVTFHTTPVGATVRLSSDAGLKDFPIGRTTPAGLRYILRFGRSSVYHVDFQLEGYEPGALTIPRGDRQTHYSVTLKQAVVREVPTMQPEVSREGYRVRLRTVRAWVEDIEREGMPASSVVRLAENQHIMGMTISADGNILVFSLGETVKDERGQEKTIANLRSVSATGGGVTEITSGQWLDNYPALSQDGYLYFCSDRLRKGGADVFRVSSEKTSAIAVIRHTPDGQNYEPCVGGNGIVVFSYQPIYPGGIFTSPHIWRLGGENQYPTQLREGSMPALSPDGKEIAYIGPDRQLWKMPVHGQNPVQLTTTVSPEGKKYPSWSPDGAYILYASDEGKDSQDVPNNDIWIIRSDGTTPQQLTTNGSMDILPVVSPDQKYIYFISNRGFKEGIWRIPFPVLGPAVGTGTPVSLGTTGR
jgi:hypothetical protein